MRTQLLPVEGPPAFVSDEGAVAAGAHQAPQQVGNWKRQFLKAGKSGPAAGKLGPSTREQQLEAALSELTQALGEAAVEPRVWKKPVEGRANPRGCGHVDHEVLLADRRARSGPGAATRPGHAVVAG